MTATFITETTLQLWQKCAEICSPAFANIAKFEGVNYCFFFIIISFSFISLCAGVKIFHFVPNLWGLYMHG